MAPRSWRLFHRWLGAIAAVFLLFAGATGVVVAASEFFGEEEAERERLRDVVSAVRIGADEAQWQAPLQRAMQAMAQKALGAPVDKIELKLKGDAPTVAISTGLADGGEDRRFVFDAKTGALLGESGYSDKPFLYRLHSGEAFGDGGLVVAMLWGLALVVLTVTGAVIYLQMRRPGAKGWRRIFW
ncbi:MAG: PepSY domain-containing protein [Planctomycetes bacterium]|nr:PepSY domain-containing protein [Planctomycetota bacterium]